MDIRPLPEQAFFKPMFDLVAPKGNWKKAIDATIAAPAGIGDFMLWCQVMERAVEFYAGGGARIEVVSSEIRERKVRVTAPGYYVMVGS